MSGGAGARSATGRQVGGMRWLPWLLLILLIVVIAIVVIVVLAVNDSDDDAALAAVAHYVPLVASAPFD